MSSRDDSIVSAGSYSDEIKCLLEPDTDSPVRLTSRLKNQVKRRSSCQLRSSLASSRRFSDPLSATVSTGALPPLPPPPAAAAALNQARPAHCTRNIYHPAVQSISVEQVCQQGRKRISIVVSSSFFRGGGPVLKLNQFKKFLEMINIVISPQWLIKSLKVNVWAYGGTSIKICGTVTTIKHALLHQSIKTVLNQSISNERLENARILWAMSEPNNIKSGYGSGEEEKYVRNA